MKQNAGSLHRLERRTRRELRDIKGIGTTKSIQIEAVMELIKRYCDEEIPWRKAFRRRNRSTTVCAIKSGTSTTRKYG